MLSKEIDDVELGNLEVSEVYAKPYTGKVLFLREVCTLSGSCNW